MGDLISRQTAIDALANYIHNADRVYSNGKLTHEDCMDAAHSVLDELPSAQQWIPVTPKTLPKKVGDYLVTTYSGQIARYIYMGNGTSKDYWMRCVIAWMALPEPYNGEQE